MKATLFLLGVLAAAASVAEAISIKSGPLTRTNRNCDGSADGPVLSQSFGTATITRAANLVVSVPILFKGTPNTAYNVRVIQLPQSGSCGPCTSGGGTLTTNAQGVGNTNVVQAVKPGATAAWIAINKKSNCNDFYTLQPLPIT
ncbi:hypothetical protein LTR66_017784 [Elasticomyces elasticus]|nr:hypothetical protein LTR66_017784 [Elasticomyces elasticus]